MKIQSRFDWAQDTGLHFRKPSRTAQQFAAEADINNLLKRYQNTGIFYDPVTMAKAAARPTFGDFSTEVDFMTAQNIVVQAREAFEALPSNVRDRFANDPGALLDFLSKEENNEEAYKLGLKVRPVEPAPVEPTKVIIVDPTAKGGAQ